MPVFSIKSQVQVAIITKVTAATLEEALAVAGMRSVHFDTTSANRAMGLKWVPIFKVGDNTAPIEEAV